MANGFSRTQGRFRRLIDLRNQSPFLVVGWLEDDFHHFGVSLEHDGKHITDVRMAAPRTPWVTCPGAAEPLRELIGKPLLRRASDIGTLLEMRQQCTHVFDLTGLAMAHAAAGRTHRRYQALVPDREILRWDDKWPILGPTIATLQNNGVEVLRWEVEGKQIRAPLEWAGQSLEQGFRAWTEAMDEEPAEYATIMRRALLVAGGRTIDHDRYESAGIYHQEALCYSFQPERSLTALRNYGATLDYAESPEGMLLQVHKIP
ncbi:DUF2889 domain-containing protein [Pseudomonas sp. NY15436]|uniref:DUF2889 domain-containing protein n=1 Tax=Pseudomonas TaxID=286 RepID=UPI001E3F47C1|nr:MULTISPECIES: DUF2889 domain-containing protein [Pseudomonas]MCE4071486.1 DUF2889 domain-containing protein [Pseudomonas nitritireducens]MCE4081262.1 DUF2889 domain-containing protein [Pseudomonas nitroreducens]